MRVYTTHSAKGCQRQYFVFLLLLNANILKAQNDNIHIAVAMPTNSTTDNNTARILKNKILNIISIQGVAGTEFGAIIAVPEINVINSKTISGGMRKINSVELSVSIIIMNMITNTVFNTIHTSSFGEGYSDVEAIRSAINKITPSAFEYMQFVEKTKNRIMDYYNNNTTAIIAKANTLAAQQHFDEALALLATYPESLQGYEKVAKAITSIFKKCQTQYCSQILISAQASYSQQKYDEAASILAMIDAQSSCAQQAKSLLESIKKSKDKEYEDVLTLEKEQIKSNEHIKTAQIKAISDIATTYFKSQTNYDFVQ